MALRLELPVARLPLAAERNPERQGDQQDVEPEALTPDVEAVVAELVAARDVAHRVDLRDARQSGPDEASLRVTGHVFERFQGAVAERFDLAGAKRPGSHE